VLNNLDRAPIAEPLRATLGLLRKITRGNEAVAPDDMRTLLKIGVTRDQIEDALNVAFAFNVITRLADTFNFEVGSPASFDAGARMLLSRGYR
jgi:hypothetical protein